MSKECLMTRDSHHTTPPPETSGVSRRTFVNSALFASAATALVQGRGFLARRGWLEAAEASPPDLVRDTIKGLFAFVVPGSDAYSIAQGMTTAEPGGVASGAVDLFMATLDATTPFVPTFSKTVAEVLNGLAQAVHPAAAGAFGSPFARLSFAEKAAVFQIMDADESLAVLGGVLPAFVAYFCYSEAGAFDPVERKLTRQPLGWQLSHYTGVSDGRDEFLGYFDGRRR
jgi:hypothetical protein